MSNPSTIKIDDQEYIRKDSALPVINTDGTPFVVGNAYLIRTVTMILTGRVHGVVGQFLVLTDAAWIADTGRFSDVLKTGNPNEVEPADGPVFVGLGSVIDAYQWSKPLPRIQK